MMASQRLVLLLLSCAGAVCAKVSTLGQSVELKADKECGSGEFVLKRALHGSQIVARLVHGVWEAQKGYGGRVQHLSPSSVLLKSVNYNDNGFFEFSCGGRLVTTIQLEVLVPISISAARGQTVTLPCHSVTAGQDVKPGKWEKEGTVVCEVDPSSQRISYGSGFEGKVSVSPEWLLTGNVSLTLEDAQRGDQGVYTCYTQKEDGRELLLAVKLTVTSSSPHQTSSTPEPQASHKADGEKCHTCIGVSAAVGLLLFLAGGVLGVMVLIRRGRHGREEGGGNNL